MGQTLNWLISHESRIALVGAIAALATAFIAYDESSRARAVSEAQTYIALKERYSVVDQELETKGLLVNPTLTEDAIFNDSKALEPLKRYWSISFDEWYVTSKTEAFPNLWDSYYLPIQIKALNERNLRAALCALRRRDFAEGLRDEYFRVIERRYSELNPGKPLCAIEKA